VLCVEVLGKVIILNEGVIHRRQGVNVAGLGQLHGTSTHNEGQALLTT
jgi:hypothetical protein